MKPNQEPTLAWQAYEDGKNYKRTIGLYKRVDENERFCRGDQWRDVQSDGLPTPVFNIIRRIVTFLVSTTLSYDLNVHYVDAGIHYEPAGAKKRARTEALEILNKDLSFRWHSADMDSVMREVVRDAAITGDGVLYCYWDTEKYGDPLCRGQIVTSVCDSVNLFAADMNSHDLQSQEYIILAGRCSVEKLKREAKDNGADEETLKKIIPDSENSDLAGDYSHRENADTNAAKCTFLIRFFRDENGSVCWEKTTRFARISGARTGMHRYPVTYFSWESVKNCLHGESPITEIIQNQKYINKAYALGMKHMIDTAFSKVIYDKRLIPEWNNEVGQAIGVLSGGDVSGAVNVLGVGQMQDDYLDLLNSVIGTTKEMTGATEVALGEVDPTNTSAILALREIAELSLDSVRASLITSVRELAMIWLEMLKEYCPPYRLGKDNDGNTFSFSAIPIDSVVSQVDTGATRRFSQSVLLSILNNLLQNGHITFAEYLERLPEGILSDKDTLLERARSDNPENETVSKEDNNGQSA